MRNSFKAEHWDQEGRPGGGCSYGVGFTISWQNGPLGQGADRREPNGAFVEDVIAAAQDRLEYYQRGSFACEENADAIHHLASALAALNMRTRDREQRDVEGTHAA